MHRHVYSNGTPPIDRVVRTVPRDMGENSLNDLSPSPLNECLRKADILVFPRINTQCIA